MSLIMFGAKRFEQVMMVCGHVVKYIKRTSDAEMDYHSVFFNIIFVKDSSNPQRILF